MKVYIDEAGRGPLAGPLYVGLVIILKKFSTKGFKDSKKLSEKQREECFQQIKNLQLDGKIIFATGSVSHTKIDKYGLTKSINIAIKSGLRKLTNVILNDSEEYKLLYPSLHSRGQKITLEQLIIDGNTDFGLSKDLKILVKTIIKGDDKIPYISMASIIAKVSRDRVMKKLHNQYPQYGFDIHKGYGTKLHYKNIKQHGISAIHRRLFLRKIK